MSTSSGGGTKRVDTEAPSTDRSDECDRLAGVIREDEDGFRFAYDAAYLNAEDATAVSLSLPLRAEPYRDRNLLPFFDGLIPEGWLLEELERNLQLIIDEKTEKVSSSRAKYPHWWLLLVDQVAYGLSSPSSK